MKVLSLFVIAYLFLTVDFLNAQQSHLDVEGHVKISGNVDLSHMDDETSVNIGRNAGVMTDFSSQQFSTFVGADAGRKNTEGNSNSFFGNSTGFNNLTGNFNAFFGAGSGSLNIDGCCNSFFGTFAGASNLGMSNSFFGQSTGFNTTTGTRNTFIGAQSGQGVSSDSLDRAIALGFNAQVHCSHCAVIGGTGADAVRVGIGISTPNEPVSFGNQTGTKINLFDDGAGIYGLGIAPAELQIGAYDNGKHISLGHYSGSSKVFVEWMQVNSSGLSMANGAKVTAGGVWTDASSRRYKENIINLGLEEALAVLQDLDPVKYNYQADSDEEFIGFIAEEVPDLVAMKDRKSLSPMDFIGVLTKVIQDQQDRISKMEMQNAETYAKLNELLQVNKQLLDRIVDLEPK